MCENTVSDREEISLLISGNESMKESKFLAISGEAKHFHTIEDSDENNGDGSDTSPKELLGGLIFSWVVMICCYPYIILISIENNIAPRI